MVSRQSAPPTGHRVRASDSASAPWDQGPKASRIAARGSYFVQVAFVTENDGLAIRREGWGAVVVHTARDLAWTAAVRGHDVDVLSAIADEAAAIASIVQALDHAWRRGPGGGARLQGIHFSFDAPVLVFRHQHAEHQ